MFGLGKIFSSGGNSNDNSENGPVSDYDGRPLNVIHGRSGGRQVEVHTSWRPGDPDR